MSIGKARVQGEPWFFTIGELSGYLRRRELSPVEVTEAVLERIAQADGSLNSYITVLSDQALQQARQAERELQRGEYRGPLHGVPLAVKDLVWTKGVATTCGSAILRDFAPQEDATLMTHLREAGAVLLGKLNMHEFAYGVTGEDSAFGACHNPWDRDRVPGGSSSGSGAAVAAGLAYGAIGTDTGGSIRIPAALCGIVGLKPTYGRVSRYGVVPLSWSFDHVGPLTRSVEDAALMLQAIAGYDPRDAASAEASVPNFTHGLQSQVKGLRLGVPREYFFDALDPEVAGAVRSATALLGELGAQVQEVSIPLLEDAGPTWNASVMPEATAYHLPYLKARADQYTPAVRDRLELGLFIPAVAYLQAQRARRLLTQQFQEVFQQVDAIVTPTTPTPAPLIGGEEVELGGRRHDARRSLGVLTRVADLTGMPCITVPCGFSSRGLPLGLQVMARHFDEATALRVAYAYELATDWHKRHPEV